MRADRWTRVGTGSSRVLRAPRQAQAQGSAPGAGSGRRAERGRVVGRVALAGARHRSESRWIASRASATRLIGICAAQGWARQARRARQARQARHAGHVRHAIGLLAGCVRLRVRSTHLVSSRGVAGRGRWRGVGGASLMPRACTQCPASPIDSSAGSGGGGTHCLCSSAARSASSASVRSRLSRHEALTMSASGVREAAQRRRVGREWRMHVCVALQERGLRGGGLPMRGGYWQCAARRERTATRAAGP